WYFVVYVLMLLFWPWAMDYERRLLLPVSALSCLYLWRGGGPLLPLARTRPRGGAACAVPGSSPLAPLTGRPVLPPGVAQSCAVLWPLLAAPSLLIARVGAVRSRLASLLARPGVLRAAVAGCWPPRSRPA